MSKINIGKINLTISDKNFKSKKDIAIDMFTKMLRDIAIKDEISIKIEKDESILIMYAEAYDVVVAEDIPISLIVSKVFNIKHMQILVEEKYDFLKKYIVYKLEYIEYKQKKESEIDEHWEHMPY